MRLTGYIEAQLPKTELTEIKFLTLEFEYERLSVPNHTLRSTRRNRISWVNNRTVLLLHLHLRICIGRDSLNREDPV